MSELPRHWYATDLDDEDLAEIRALFALVFGAPMSEKLWHWKYSQGRGCATGTRADNGELLAHYGGTSRSLRSVGETLAGVQMGDVMVHPSVRGILSRKGPFTCATRAFLDRHVATPRGFDLGFGFPNDRHTRLGERLGLYRALGDILEATWNTQPPHPLRHWSATPIDWGAESTDARLDSLWAQQCHDTPLVTSPVRDAAWWRHRFANHPEHAYRGWWVKNRWTRGLWGAVILRLDAPGAQPIEWMDWIGAPERWPQLLQASRCIAATLGAPTLSAWMSAPLLNAMKERGAEPPDQQRVACQYCVTERRDARVTEAMLQSDWWLTGGDTDFR